MVNVFKEVKQWRNPKKAIAFCHSEYVIEFAGMVWCVCLFWVMSNCVVHNTIEKSWSSRTLLSLCCDRNFKKWTFECKSEFLAYNRRSGRVMMMKREYISSSFFFLKTKCQKRVIIDRAKPKVNKTTATENITHPNPSSIQIINDLFNKKHWRHPRQVNELFHIIILESSYLIVNCWLRSRECLHVNRLNGRFSWHFLICFIFSQKKKLWIIEFTFTLNRESRSQVLLYT